MDIDVGKIADALIAELNTTSERNKWAAKGVELLFNAIAEAKRKAQEQLEQQKQKEADDTPK